jgi:hypothetical protein
VKKLLILIWSLTVGITVGSIWAHNEPIESMKSSPHEAGNKSGDPLAITVGGFTTYGMWKFTQEVFFDIKDDEDE